MPNYLIAHDKAWNVYSTISHKCLFNKALTFDEFQKWYMEQYGFTSGADFQERVDRTLENGCSAYDFSLDEIIKTNRAGMNERALSKEDFIKHFLTLENQ